MSLASSIERSRPIWRDTPRNCRPCSTPGALRGGEGERPASLAGENPRQPNTGIHGPRRGAGCVGTGASLRLESPRRSRRVGGCRIAPLTPYRNVVGTAGRSGRGLFWSSLGPEPGPTQVTPPMRGYPATGASRGTRWLQVRVLSSVDSVTERQAKRGKVIARYLSNSPGVQPLVVVEKQSRVPGSGVTRLGGSCKREQLATTVPMEVDVRDHRAILHEGLTNMEEDDGGQRERGPARAVAQAGER